jgi:peptidylprolyl isomerase
MREKVLAAIQKEDKQLVEEILAWPEDSAGGIMQPIAFRLREDQTCRDAIAALHEQQEHLETIFYVYVENEGEQLVGVTSLRALLTHSPSTVLRDIMTLDVISVSALDDQEDVARIVELASEGFYDGVVFHRVINGFMAQGGDPTGTGMGGSDKPDLAAEFNAEPHVEGVCSMARAQNPNSANSQFFICLDDARFLDKQYTVWGQVTSGMEHVHALPKGEPPRAPGKIVKATVA